MKNLKDIILERLRINKDTKHIESNEIRIEFQNDESINTLNFILNCIERSKPGTFSSSIFGYWEMYINKNVLSCMRIGWSRDGIGHQKSSYINKCVDNYNKDNGTSIKVSISGWSANAGVSILKIKEVVDALKKKYSNFKIENESELVSVL